MDRFDGLYRKHHQDVFRTCLRFAAGDRAWALDRTQDVFVTLARKLENLAETEDLGAWLYRVAVNASLMELRRERGWRAVVGRLFAGGESPSPERQVQARRDLGALERVLTELEPSERALVVLVYVEGKSQTEAAELMGISKGYASKLHTRAMTALKARQWEVSDA